MKINLAIEGTPEQLRAFIFGGLVEADLTAAQPSTDDYLRNRAGSILERAVANGGTLIALPRPERKPLVTRTIGGCEVKGFPEQLDEMEAALARCSEDDSDD